MGKRYTRFLGRVERWFRRSDPHLRATDEMSDLEQFELAVLDAALQEGTTVAEQRELMGFLAPPHQFTPDKELRCSVCRRPHKWPTV